MFEQNKTESDIKDDEIIYENIKVACLSIWDEEEVIDKAKELMEKYESLLNKGFKKEQIVKSIQFTRLGFKDRI